MSEQQRILLFELLPIAVGLVYLLCLGLGIQRLRKLKRRGTVTIDALVLWFVLMLCAPFVGFFALLAFTPQSEDGTKRDS